MKNSLKNQLSTCDEALLAVPPEMKHAEREIKVVLVQAPETGGVQTLLPHFEEGMKHVGYKPPLGLLFLASTLTADTSHDVKIVDCIAQSLDLDAAVAEIMAGEPDVVGISAWTDFWWPAYRLGEMLKAAKPSLHLCYGGPHVGVYPKETLGIPFVDSVVVGDGEIPFKLLCNTVANGADAHPFPGLHIKKSGLPSEPLSQYIQSDLDALPLIDRTLLPVENYGSVLGKGALSTTMITSRGCPYKCSFCKLNFQKTLARSPANVIAEFEAIAALGIDEVEIYDDTFTWGRDRLKDICNGLIKNKNTVTWAVRDRVSAASPEAYAMMYEAGCRRIHLGVESGVQHVLDGMRKRIKPDQARQAVKWAKEAGLEVLTYFLIGNMDETVEDMKATVDFALELGSDYAEFSITIPYPGTELYRQALSNGLISNDYWLEYARAPHPEFVLPQVIEGHAKLAEMQSILKAAYRRFYYRPSYIWRELMRIQNINELLRKMQMAKGLTRSVFVK